MLSMLDIFNSNVVGDVMSGSLVTCGMSHVTHVTDETVFKNKKFAEIIVDS